MNRLFWGENNRRAKREIRRTKQLRESNADRARSEVRDFESQARTNTPKKPVLTQCSPKKELVYRLISIKRTNSENLRLDKMRNEQHPQIRKVLFSTFYKIEGDHTWSL